MGYHIYSTRQLDLTPPSLLRWLGGSRKARCAFYVVLTVLYKGAIGLSR